MLILLPGLILAQNNGVKIPAFNDEYSMFVKKLESGDTNINYAAFRHSYLNSKQFEINYKQKTDIRSLKNDVYSKIKEKNYQGVIAATKLILSKDYTSMFAHKYLYQTYKILKDEKNEKKYHAIEMGLLRSIIKSGDGISCETAWEVVQIDEEYFILDMIDAKLNEQTIKNSPHNICDKMNVTQDDGTNKDYYFGISRLLERENEFIK